MVMTTTMIMTITMTTMMVIMIMTTTKMIKKHIFAGFTSFTAFSY